MTKLERAIADLREMTTGGNVKPRGRGKAFWKRESVSITGWRDCTSRTTDRQTTNTWVCICRRKAQEQLCKRRIHFFCHLPLEGWFKKSLYKRYMCSFSGMITGPPRFSFRFQMRSDMFRLAHLCSVSTELQANSRIPKFMHNSCP